MVTRESESRGNVINAKRELWLEREERRDLSRGKERGVMWWGKEGEGRGGEDGFGSGLKAGARGGRGGCRRGGGAAGVCDRDGWREGESSGRVMGPVDRPHRRGLVSLPVRLA